MSDQEITSNDPHTVAAKATPTVSRKNRLAALALRNKRQPVLASEKQLYKIRKAKKHKRKVQRDSRKRNR